MRGGKCQFNREPRRYKQDNWFGQALLGNDVATVSNLVLAPGRLSSAGQAAISSPLKYTAGQLRVCTMRCNG